MADTWEDNYEFLENEYAMKSLFALRNKKEHVKYHETCLEHKNNGVPHWETVESYARFMNHQLCIIPSVNLVQNVGLGENSTHSNLSLQDIPSALREVYYCKGNEMEFPLKHPKYVFENVLYRQSFLEQTGRNNKRKAFALKVKGVLLRFKNGNGKIVVKGIKRRLKIK